MTFVQAIHADDQTKVARTSRRNAGECVFENDGATGGSAQLLCRKKKGVGRGLAIQLVVDDGVAIDAAAELLSDAKVDERVVDRLRAEHVRAVVGRLPAEQREVLALAFWGGYSQSEIATRTGTPLGTVKSRVRLAMNKLRESLEDER